jgi:hypothetical protein
MFPKHFDEFIIGTIDFVLKPISFPKVVVDKKWKLSMLKKMDYISYNWTWQLYELPPGKKPTTTRWFYKILNGSSGKPSKFKARLMAKGCEQKEGLDFQETFTLIIKWITIRSMIALVAHYGRKFSQMDMKIVFLNGDLHDEEYMM